jgi:MYXO-CTERM domain-containing protein
VRPAPAAGDRQGQGPMLGFYYLEMRSSYGFDGTLKPMVTVSIGADLPTATRASPYLYLLDMVPSTTTLNDAGLMTVGQSYADPGGGLTITLTAISTTSATVTVTSAAGTGGHTCADNSAFTAPGPDATSCGPLVGASDAGPPVIIGGSDAGGGTGGTMTTRDAGGAAGRANDAGRDGAAGASVADAAVDTGRGAVGGSAGTGGASVTGAGGAAGGSTGGGPTAGTGGVTGNGGGNPGSDGSVIAGSSTPGGGSEPASGGCSCSTIGSAPRHREAAMAGWALLGLLGATRWRRRRATGSSPLLTEAPIKRS